MSRMLSVLPILAGLTSTAIRTALGHQLVQQCQSLRTQLSCEKIDAGQVSPRPGEAGDETELDGVFADAEDDRNSRGRSFGGKRSSVARGPVANRHATNDKA